MFQNCTAECAQNFYLQTFFLITIEQDKGLDALHAVIQRQKLMGQTIGNEVDYQNGKRCFEC